MFTLFIYVGLIVLLCIVMKFVGETVDETNRLYLISRLKNRGCTEDEINKHFEIKDAYDPTFTTHKEDHMHQLKMRRFEH